MYLLCYGMIFHGIRKIIVRWNLVSCAANAPIHHTTNRHYFAQKNNPGAWHFYSSRSRISSPNRTRTNGSSSSSNINGITAVAMTMVVAVSHNGNANIVTAIIRRLLSCAYCFRQSVNKIHTKKKIRTMLARIEAFAPK